MPPKLSAGSPTCVFTMEEEGAVNPRLAIIMSFTSSYNFLSVETSHSIHESNAFLVERALRFISGGLHLQI